METLLGIALGLALSAACGFRVFVPLLALGAAQATGHLSLAPGFAWIGSTPALIAFGAATGIEIAAYYVPWLDNLLDSIATPAAVVAGIVVTASVVTDMDPLWRWTLAVVAGGGLAGTVQSSTTLLRAISTGTTGGLANSVLATGELGSAVAISVFALLVPLLALALVIIGLALVVAWLRRRRAVPRADRAPHAAELR
jgi:NADH:ubiquinone oxidoreductase subunit K